MWTPVSRHHSRKPGESGAMCYEASTAAAMQENPQCTAITGLWLRAGGDDYVAVSTGEIWENPASSGA